MVVATSFNFFSFPRLKRNYWNKRWVIKGRWENIQIKICYYNVIQNSITITCTVTLYGTEFVAKFYSKIFWHDTAKVHLQYRHVTEHRVRAQHFSCLVHITCSHVCEGEFWATSYRCTKSGNFGAQHGLWLLPAHRPPATWMTRLGQKPKDLRRCST